MKSNFCRTLAWPCWALRRRESVIAVKSKAEITYFSEALPSNCPRNWVAPRGCWEAHPTNSSSREINLNGKRLNVMQLAVTQPSATVVVVVAVSSVDCQAGQSAFITRRLYSSTKKTTAVWLAFTFAPTSRAGETPRCCSELLPH